MDLTKSTLGLVMPNLCFLHPVGSAGHVVHPEHETTTFYFSSSGGTSTDLKNAHRDTLH
jgi:hypothetical protein